MARWVLAAMLVLGTVVMALSRDDHHAPVADLHADAPYYYVYLPSLLHGDLDFTDEYRETKNWYHLGTTPLGRQANVFGIGPAVFDAPLFLLGHAAALISGSRSDGFSKWEVWGYTWTSLLFTLGAVFVAARLVRRRGLAWHSGLDGLVGPLLAALAGPVVYYAVRQPGYAHAVATFWATLLVERWDASYEEPRTLRTWLVLGAVLGAAMLARPQLALWGVILAPAAIEDLRRDWKSIRFHLAALAAALVVFSPQMFAWKALYGAWWVVPQGPGFMRWDAPCWTETLFSSRNGLFPWSPAYLLLLIALLCAVKKLPRLVIALVVGLVLQAIANGAAWDWWAGGSFGGRRFDSCYVVFAVGAAVLVEYVARKRPWKDWISPIATGSVVWFVVMANVWLAGRYTVTSARIYGGVPASRVIAEKVPDPFGMMASWISAASNLPVRLAFKWKHDVPLAAYDKLVGVNLLGETYPGLNSYADSTSGIVPGGTIAASGKLRLFVGLNRRGGVTITLPPGVTATWNGDPFTGHTEDLVRGINELELTGPPGTEIKSLPIAATP
jgi:hypothetical protein